MALALRELQAAFVAHLLSNDDASAAPSIAGDSIPAVARLRVHRHHVFTSLGKALAATFPTVQRLVGEECFMALARGFVATTLPQGPVLAEYGAAFPGFLQDHPSVRALPYIADVARLEWALNTAFYSPVEHGLTSTDLSAIPIEELPLQRLTLAVGTALIRSDYPLDAIWATAQPGAPDQTVDLGAGGVRLLVFRRPDDAGFVGLGGGEAALAAALMPGASLEEAASAAAAAEPDLDLSRAFARLLGLGVLLRCSKVISVTA